MISPKFYQQLFQISIFLTTVTCLDWYYGITYLCNSYLNKNIFLITLCLFKKNSKLWPRSIIYFVTLGILYFSVRFPEST